MIELIVIIGLVLVVVIILFVFGWLSTLLFLSPALITIDTLGHRNGDIVMGYVSSTNPNSVKSVLLSIGCFVGVIILFVISKHISYLMNFSVTMYILEAISICVTGLIDPHNNILRYIVCAIAFVVGLIIYCISIRIKPSSLSYLTQTIIGGIFGGIVLFFTVFSIMASEYFWSEEMEALYSKTTIYCVISVLVTITILALCAFIRYRLLKNMDY